MVGISECSNLLTIANFCPYWSSPPTGGGPLRVHFLNKTISNYFRVLQFSARPTFGHQRLGWSNWVGRRLVEINQNYLEFQYFHPLILLFGIIFYKMNLHSDIFLSELLKLLAMKNLEKIVSEASIIQVEHPWMFNVAYQLSNGKPLIFVAHNVEGDLWESCSRNKKVLIPSFAEKPGILEQFAFSNAHSIVAMSPEDATRIEKKYQVNLTKIEIIPNGVDLESRSISTQQQKKSAKKRLNLDGCPVILFMGSDHYPNKEALSNIQCWRLANLDGIYPQILVIGTVSRDLLNTRQLRIDGYIHDISDYLQAADIAINPISSGSGTSLKVVEYLACGLPTISTDIGIRGLDLEPGRDLLVGEINEFPGLIDRLLSDISLQRKLALNGRRTVEKKYSWEILGERMQQIYNRLVT